MITTAPEIFCFMFCIILCKLEYIYKFKKTILLEISYLYDTCKFFLFLCCDILSGMPGLSFSEKFHLARIIYIYVSTVVPYFAIKSLHLGLLLVTTNVNNCNLKILRLCEKSQNHHVLNDKSEINYGLPLKMILHTLVIMNGKFMSCS